MLNYPKLNSPKLEPLKFDENKLNFDSLDNKYGV